MTPKSSGWPMIHRPFMRRAIQLARRGLGRVSPNPMVGCVVVRGGRVVGEGYHLFQRRHHAETLALSQAGGEARGADLYVNLEPCCHKGRTPPCVEKIIEAGVARVFVAIEDPNPEVKGRGLRRLKKAGIQVDLGLCAEEASLLNERFLHFIQTGRPFTQLKLALTLDGKIATRSGQSKWITGPRSRHVAHRLRYQADAILVGVETLLQDDPSLTVRWTRTKPITRAVLDSNLRTPPGSRLFQSNDAVILFHRDGIEGKSFPSQTELVPVSENAAGELDWMQVLTELGNRSISSLLVEGGSRVAASLLRRGLAQKIAFFYAPKIIGKSGLSGVGELGFSALAEAVQLQHPSVRFLAPDFLVEGYPRLFEEE